MGKNFCDNKEENMEKKKAIIKPTKKMLIGVISFPEYEAEDLTEKLLESIGNIVEITYIGKEHYYFKGVLYGLYSEWQLPKYQIELLN